MLDTKSNIIEMTAVCRKRYFSRSENVQKATVLPFADYRNAQQPRRRKVLIAHHQPIMIVGIRSVVEQAGHEVVMTCSRPSDLGMAFISALPDLLVLSASFCEDQVLRMLKANDRFAATIVIGEEAPVDQIGDYMAEGVGGIITTSSDDALLSCVKAVVAGGRWFDADFRDRWLQLQLRRSG